MAQAWRNSTLVNRLLFRGRTL
jgi:hypothetical protein